MVCPVNYLFSFQIANQNDQYTPPIAEIIWVKNVRAIVVCGFLMKSIKKKYPENLKKIVGAIWELPAK